MTYHITRSSREEANESVKRTLASTARTMGVHLNEGAFDEAYSRLSEIDDSGEPVTDSAVRSVVDDIVCRRGTVGDLVESYR